MRATLRGTRRDRDNVRKRCDALAQQTEHVKQQTHAREARPPMVERWQRWGRLPWPLAAVAALGLAVALPRAGQAETFACGAGDVACLIAAITEANANGQTNTIDLEAGTYTLTAVDNETDGPNGLPSITSPLTIQGVGVTRTILERAAPAPRFRLVHVAASGALTLARVRLKGGHAPFVDGGCAPPVLCVLHSFDGGGLFNQAGTVTLTQSTVTENFAEGRGGGLFTQAGTVTLRLSTVAKNRAFESGGGLGNHAGTVTLSQSMVAENGAVEHGGLFNHAGTMTLRRSTVTGNGSSGGGGGIGNREGTMTLTQSLVDRNESGGGVGGLDHGGGILHITQSHIIGNRAPSGTVGGVFAGGTVTMTRSTIAGNAGSNTGGMFIGVEGVAMLDGSAVVANVGHDSAGIVNIGQLHLTNSTMARNSGFDVGGLANFGKTVLLNATIAANEGGVGIGISRGTVTLQNTILARNTFDCGRALSLSGTSSESIISLGNNLIGDPQAGDCRLTLQSSDRTGDPGFDTFTENGTPGTEHFPLLPTSRARDAGNQAVCPTVDQLGRLRSRPCDIGAIEFGGRDDRQPDAEDDAPDADPAAVVEESP